MNDSSSRHLLYVLGLAMGLLIMLSAMPWSTLTGNVIKDFDLFEELFPTPYEVVAVEPDMVDPELERFIAESTAAPAVPQDTAPAALSTPAVSAGDTVAAAVYVADPVVSGGEFGIESYAPDGSMLPSFTAALSQSASRPVNIAFVGDSFIEGDIICQDLRDMLQQRYGGAGVGFVAMHSEFPGFRGSVRQSDSGWKLKDVRGLSRSDTLRTLSGDYSVAAGSAHTHLKGSDFSERAGAWGVSSLMFISPAAGKVTLRTDAGDLDFDVEASPEVRALSVDGLTKVFDVRTSIPGFIALGAYADNAAGIRLDCMSVRGNSGVSLGRINADLCRAMARHRDYDLIVLEFGMNALSAQQKNYSPYTAAMKAGVERVRAAYPHADILIIGIGDRGIKSGTEVVSMPTCAAMTMAQRETARQTGAHFWDARAAMGGEGAAGKWRKRGLVNADYIHLNHKGGREMASLLFDALISAADEN